MATPTGKWYDENNYGEMHADLRDNYRQTVDVISSRILAKRHFDSCGICKTISDEQESRRRVAPLMPFRARLRRRKRLVITFEQLHEILGLDSEEDVLRVDVDGHRDYIEVTICGPQHPPIADGEEPPIAMIQAVAA